MVKNMLQQAIYVALDAHEGQVDRGGHPYVNHPFYLCTRFDNLGTKVTALLHDVIEDSDKYTLDDIEEMFGKVIRNAVDAISKRKGQETYQEYLERVKSNEIARLVKLADINHNLDKKRIPFVDEKYDRMAKKYEKALEYLI